MIQNPISIDEAVALSKATLDTLFEATQLTGAVAGGFLRDAYCGKVAKDIDVYITSPANKDEEQIDAMVKKFYDQLGYEYHLHKRIEPEVVAAPPPRPGRRRLFEEFPENGGYPTVLRVYSTTKCPEGTYPIDLVFTPINMFHSFQFDMNLCNISVQRNGRLHASQAFLKDVADKTLTLQMLDDPIAAEMRNWAALAEGEQFDRSYIRLVNHINRVKEKYEDHRVVFSPDFIQTPDGVKTFNRMIEEGIIGDPRTFFQAKRQEPVGDEVRLEDGAEAVPTVDDFIRETRAQRTNRAIDALLAARAPDWINPFADVEAGTGRLFGGAPVQPGPDVIVYDEAE
ncbi:hypothetical protein SCYZ1_34 [Pseudomonas phage SCYZ1]|nr:hypothetical protein SCYZ1_34 [Pseudomonas phage SCYZ1]